MPGLDLDRMTRITSNKTVQAFDCNGYGRLDFADVFWLFNNL